MLEYVSYIVCFGTLFIVLGFLYIRVKYGFWVLQPVFHVYDIGYMFNPPGIIQQSLPDANKYVNLKDIDTLSLAELTNVQQSKFVQLIQSHYLQNKDNVFSPTADHILPYFVGHTDTSIVSFFYQDRALLDTKTTQIVTDRKIIGAITSRPINIHIYNDKNNADAKLRAYYVDYLCVDTLHRKRGIAPQLIQTHHYNQRRNNPRIAVSLFKREDELTGIVPLCVYSTYGFPVDTWTQPPEMSGAFKLLSINGTNFRFVYDFVRLHGRQFDIVIQTDMANLLELIKTSNVFVYAILCDNNIVACYFYRKSCVQIERGMETLSLFASIRDCEDDVFVHGFKISFWKIAAEHFFGFAALENISHNNTIIHHIMLKTKPRIVSPTAYYFYNFAYPTFAPEKVLLLN